MIGDLMSVQLIAESNILEAHQGGQEALSDPIHDNSSHSAGIIISSSEVFDDEFDDEAYSSNSNSIFLCADSMEDKAPLSVQGGPFESKDEMNFAFLDTPILLNEVTSAESWTDNAECSQYIRDNACIHDGNQVPPKTSERANFSLEESVISSEVGIKSEIFSLYSRSSSCVSEVNMIETLSGVALPEPKKDSHFSFDERNPTMALNMFHSDSCTNNASSAEFITDINMVEALSSGNYSRSSPSTLDENLIEIPGAVQQVSFELNHEYPSSFEVTSLYGNSSYNPMPSSHASMKVSVRYGEGLPDPVLEEVGRFDKIPVDELSNKLLNENEVQAEISYTKTEYCSEASNLDNTEASESVAEGLFEPEHQGRPELMLSQVGMPFFIDDCKETEEYRGNSNVDSSLDEISILEAPQELPVAAGTEKDKEPKDFGKKKDSGINGNEDLDEDHKSTPINLLEAA